VDRLGQQHEDQPQDEEDHVEEEDPAKKVEETSNTRAVRTCSVHNVRRVTGVIVTVTVKAE